MKQKTIIDCWRKTGILLNLPQQITTDGSNAEQNAIEIQNLIEQIHNPLTAMTANEYIQIDANIETEAPLTDEWIVQLVHDNEDQAHDSDSDSDDIEPIKITSAQALEHPQWSR